jgi:hypothetical protein
LNNVTPEAMRELHAQTLDARDAQPFGKEL